MSEHDGMLQPGAVAGATALRLTHESLPADQIVSGSPTTAWHALAAFADVEVGVWEMAPGTATDTESDEVFVVLSGHATVRFLDPESETIEVAAGDVVRLTAGMQTEWNVTETLRKVYIVRAE